MGVNILTDSGFIISQLLNSLQFSMLLFLLAIGLSVIFGLMDYLNLAHGTMYMLSACIAVSITNHLGSFWLALALAPIVTTAIGLVLYLGILRRVASSGHLAQVLMTVGVIYVGDDSVRMFYGDVPNNVPLPEVLTGMINILGQEYPAYRFMIIGLGLAVLVALYLGFERTRLGAIVRAGVDDRGTVETLGIDIGRIFMFVFSVGTYLAGLAGVIAAPIFGVYPGMDVSIIVLVLIVVVVGGLGSLGGAILGSLLIGFADTFGKILLPSFAMVMIYCIMAIVLIFRPGGLIPARRLRA